MVVILRIAHRNGWSATTTDVFTRGHSTRVHCRQGSVGARDSPSALPWPRPARCTIVNWNWCNVCSHLAIMPSVSLKRCSHTNDLWSVHIVNLAPRRYERNCIHIETTASISLFVVQYLRCDGRRARLQ